MFTRKVQEDKCKYLNFIVSLNAHDRGHWPEVVPLFQVRPQTALAMYEQDTNELINDGVLEEMARTTGSCGSSCHPPVTSWHAEQ